MKMKKQLLEKLDQWYGEGKHQQIVDAILEIPSADRDYELTGLLAVAYNNLDKYDKAIELLLSTREQGENDRRWYYRLGYAYYYSDQYDDALALAMFEKCNELDGDSPDPDILEYIEDIKEFHYINYGGDENEEDEDDEDEKTDASDSELQTFTPPTEAPTIEYLVDMYSDDYYPDFLVDKIKRELELVVEFIMSGSHTYKEIQHKLDVATLAINDLEEEFDEHDSEIETVARDSIGMTVATILEKFGIDIDIETAIRERDW